MKRIFILFFLPVLIIGYDGYAHSSDAVVVSQPGSGKLLSDWLQLQFRLIRNTTGVAHVAYSRHFAYTSIALYESIVHSDPQFQSLATRLQGYALSSAEVTAKNFCWQYDADIAIAEMFRFFYGNNPANLRLIDSMQDVEEKKYVKQHPRETLKLSESYGKNIAAFVIKWAKSDGADKANEPYSIPQGKGLWVPTSSQMKFPAAPYWCNNRTIIEGSANIALPPPVEFSEATSSAFYKMAKDLYDISLNLTHEQKNIALFWDDNPDGIYLTVFGHWSSILAQVIQQQNLSLKQSAIAFVKMSVAMYDASVACWKGKYRYNLLRPVTFITQYMHYSTWTPLIETPPHPEYPAAHATLSAAAATALTNIFGVDFSFVDHTYDINMQPRSFTNFDSAAREAGISRFYGGIHYMPSIEAGWELGKETALNVLKNLKFNK